MNHPRTPAIRLNKQRRSQASALLITVILLLIASVSIASLLSFVTYQSRSAERLEIYNDELNAAEYAMNNMLGQISFYAYYKPIQVGGQITNFHSAVMRLQPPELEGYAFSESRVTCVQGSELQYSEVTEISDDYYGYSILRIVYDITVRAKRTDGNAERLEHPGVKLQRRVRVDSVPLYIFGIFYSNTLEIWPGPDFDMYGKVHSNEDMFLGAGNTARYHQTVTSAGQIYAGKRHPDSGRTDGNSASRVRIRDRVSGNLFSMENNGPIDYEELGGDWVQAAFERWGGYVRDEHHGMNPLRVAIPDTENPHVLIERANPDDQPAVANTKFANKADLTIQREADGEIHGYNASGNEIELRYENDDGDWEYVYNETQFYNDREGTTVRCLEVDIAKLTESGIPLGSGLIYVSELPASGMQPAVRIANAATLPPTISGGFTMASDNPLYVLGDFNVGDNHKGALLAGDSINILSNAWDDEDNDSSGDGLRNASQTETNALFLSGNVPSGGGDYSGGAENYFRYLENWSGRTHKFRGSILNLFESATATGTWIYGGRYYEAPNRDWGWDSVFNTISPPPGMLDVFILTFERWEIAA